MDTPEYVILEGRGTFAHADFSFESPFILLRNPWWVGILAGEENVILAFEAFTTSPGVTWQLSGTLNDGRHVKSDSMFITRTPHGPHCIEFTVSSELSLGLRPDASPLQSHFPLTGYFDEPLTFNYRDWGIKIEGRDSQEGSKNLAKRWQLPVEGMSLKLVHPDASTANHFDMARTVMILLSLAVGSGISSNRHFFTWEEGKQEVWLRMTGHERGPGPIVPSFDMALYLQVALAKFDALTPKKQSDLRLAVDYLNLSANGYLDTRLFHITQPWEFLAKTWKHEGKLSKEILCLRKQLNQTIKKWRNDHVNIDQDGFWGTRVSSVFDWPKLKDAIEQLATSFDLDLRKLGLDLDQLKDARNKVAHSGKLPEKLRQALDLLTQAQRCLQLLLLRMLGYEGRVYKPKAGWQSVVSMEQALKGGNQTIG